MNREAATVADALREATDRLVATSDTARLDTELLMSHALEVTRSELLLNAMQDAVPASFAEVVARRARHEPVAHIVGSQEFYGLTLTVTSDVLIPRSDSECLIEAAVELFGDHPPARICDLGTGSGALLLAALRSFPHATGVGIERSAAARKVASRNARALGFGSERCRIVAGDWSDTGWARNLGIFELVLCNPPYVEAGAELEPSVIKYEPHAALFAGADGLDDYRCIIPQLRALLTDRGVALLEIGSTQAGAVTALAQASGFHVELRRDLADRPRALVLR